jgi:hypothetical protein
MWSPGEIYVCGDPDCRSRVLILGSSLQDPAHLTLPKCVCGTILEIAGTVSSVADEGLPQDGPEDKARE